MGHVQSERCRAPHYSRRLLFVRRSADQLMLCGCVAVRLARESGDLTQKGLKQTMSSREVQFACNLLMEGELFQHAKGEGIKAVVKFTESKQ